MTVQIWSEYSYGSVYLKWIQLGQCTLEMNTAMTVYIWSEYTNGSAYL